MLLLDRTKKQEGTITILTFVKPAGLGHSNKILDSYICRMEKGEQEPKGEGKNRDALKIISAQFTFFPELGPTRPFIPTFSTPQLPVTGTKNATHCTYLLPSFWKSPKIFAVCNQFSFNQIRSQSSSLYVDSPLISLRGR